MKVTVVGGGTWGTAFSSLLAERGHEVTLACRDPLQAAAIAENGRNPRYLPELELAGVEARTLEADALTDCELLGIAVPSHEFRGALENLPDSAPLLILTKGLDPSSGRRLSELTVSRPTAVLVGPNHAEEIARGLPAAAVVASEDEPLAARVQDAVHSSRFRVYLNDDVVGVELCAAVKNVMALAAGAVDGLGLGDNAKAALISRGLAEMGRLAAACGARPETFAGLAGMGDLVVTRLEQVQPQPTGGRARCPRPIGRRGRAARSAWSSRGSPQRRCSEISRSGSRSSCLSPRRSAGSSTAVCRTS